MHHRSYYQGGLPPEGVCLWGDLPPRGGLPWGGESVSGSWADPPRPKIHLGTTGYGQQAGGTHPTGILSYLQYIIIKLMLVSLYVRYILK